MQFLESFDLLTLGVFPDDFAAVVAVLAITDVVVGVSMSVVPARSIVSPSSWNGPLSASCISVGSRKLRR